MLPRWVRTNSPFSIYFFAGKFLPRVCFLILSNSYMYKTYFKVKNIPSSQKLGVLTATEKCSNHMTYCSSASSRSLGRSKGKILRGWGGKSNSQAGKIDALPAPFSLEIRPILCSWGISPPAPLWLRSYIQSFPTYFSHYLWTRIDYTRYIFMKMVTTRMWKLIGHIIMYITVHIFLFLTFRRTL